MNTNMDNPRIERGTVRTFVADAARLEQIPRTRGVAGQVFSPGAICQAGLQVERV
jgi:hypothetical protein